MSVHAPGTRWYNAVWRWHFYAGLFCIPFVIWLALTGTIYTWGPQIEAWLDRPYAHVAAGAPSVTPDAQIAAALGAVPGASLHKYQLPDTPDQAVQILVGKQGIERRVYVHPANAQVLKVAVEEQRPLRLVFHLHGELLAGPLGSVLVEIAACWAIVMLLTGLYLWWPRGRRGLAGVVYPRLKRGGRVFWRDLHAVAGIWVAVAACFLIVTGLPWAQAWGSYLGEIRTMAGATDGPIDWTIGGKAPETPASDPMLGDHAEHMGMAMAHRAPAPGDLARVIHTARPLALAPPVLIAPPLAGKPGWTVSSDAANRPLRAQVIVDGTTGAVLARKDFAERHWIDRLVGYGIAIHEGAYFGIANQIAGTLTALLLVTLAVSGAVMWWRRRPAGLLGAPLPLSRPRFGWALVGGIGLLGIALPLFGVTLIAVLVVERTLLRRVPGPRRWLGLGAA
ncbi:PepSY-associated TM helix domain-containing protein [Hephaestia sp. GCM10023244]|uniref:PepSY-associated TM helix domain-containing protein n=1 Tax=unclassified Hephaestia TaxID=2631281 RepID=UPI0020779307|nr:PepSY domain-containing protein [Hephaestia sp. MAHUQ-44]MCM8731883.1 PepSY domain-containing protein [Hephaestia sp. MAHUQ-44]